MRKDQKANKEKEKERRREDRPHGPDLDWDDGDFRIHALVLSHPSSEKRETSRGGC